MMILESQGKGMKAEKGTGGLPTLTAESDADGVLV